MPELQISAEMEVGDDWVLCFPELTNISCWKPPVTMAKTLFINITLYSFSVLTAILNLLIIISVSHFRQLHTPTNILLLSLAVSDFLVGLLLMPFETIKMTQCWLFGYLGCSVFRFGTDIIFSTTVLNMVLISVDRYVAICDPLHYSTRITLNRIKFSVFLLWFWSVASNCYFFLRHIAFQIVIAPCYGDCVTLSGQAGALFDVITHFIFPVTVIIVLYTRVFVVAVSQARAMRSHITAVTKQISVTKTAKKSELKAARTLGVLVVVFLTCFTPSYILSLAKSYNPNHSTANLIMFLYYFNSFLNPVIYALFYSWFRKAVKLIVTLQILQPGSSVANIL